MKDRRRLTLIGIILAAAAMRLLPHPPNFTPVGAIALFGGAWFRDRRAAFAVPLAAMVLSDIVLGLFLYPAEAFHRTMPFVYAALALTVVVGRWVGPRVAPGRVAAASFAGSVLFFVVSNLGVWAAGGLYPGTPGGLLACYAAAVPFFGNTVLGDALYNLVLFGGFALAQRWAPVLREREGR
ncbi:MAG: hypothetical protein HY509_03700 [Acidobacteria bacterium]|nr:hypothetical protein [Acidobacteriota bacterium]